MNRRANVYSALGVAAWPLRIAAPALFALAAGCAGADATELGGTSSMPAERAPASVDDRALRLTQNTSDAVSGTLSGEDAQINFFLERSADRLITSVYSDRGDFILRATLGQQLEALELGTDASIEGPRGTIFSRSGPDWQRVTQTGDLAQATRDHQPEIELLAALGPSLAKRNDVDPTIISTLSGGEGAGAGTLGSSNIGTARQAIGADCGACVAACQLDFGLCAALAGIFYGLCIPPLINCMSMCTDYVCQ